MIEHLKKFFRSPGKDNPLVSHSSFSYEVTDLMTELKKDPKTAEIMKAIGEGPNTTLHKKMAERIKNSYVVAERGEYLLQATNSLFLGNAITDAHIEGIISSGSPINWKNRLEGILWEKEITFPGSELLRTRVNEILKGEFSLPQNNLDLKENIYKQTVRIKSQLTSGVLQRKAHTMGINPKKGEEVGQKMLEALEDIKSYFVY